MTASPAPIVGVGAAVWKEDRVLMIRRANDPGAGRWSIPGGKLEFGETCEQAALREIAEETGIVCETVALVGVYDAFIRTEEDQLSDHFCLINYAARWLSGTPIAGDDALEAHFMTLAEIDGLDLWGDVRGVIRDSQALIIQE